MNKILILILAVCLVSVHAFVKRDAPEAAKKENKLEQLGKQVSEMFEEAKDHVSESLNPDNIKKGFNEMVDGFNKVINDLKPKENKA